jgi:aurora kinase
VQPFRTMEVANLEAAFERITVTDENNEQIASTTSYHKAKVHQTLSYTLAEVLTLNRLRCRLLHH